MNRKTGFILFLTALLLAGCGGDLVSATGGGENTLSVTIANTVIESNRLEGTESVDVTLECSGNDIFDVFCRVDSIEVSWDDNVRLIPINRKLKVGETEEMELEFFTNSDRELEPFSYLRDVNPSAASTGWTVYTEVIGEVQSRLLATTPDDCVPNSGETAAVCPKAFSVTVDAYAPGTLCITDGSQTLEESSFGVLSGDGNGVVESGGGEAQFQFSSTPDRQTFIMGMSVSPLRELGRDAEARDLRITYGDFTLEQEGSVLLDESGEVFGMLDGRKVVPLRSWGFRSAPVVARYSSSPFNAFGGEIIGHGDGTSSVFSLKTKHAPVLESSLEVFTDRVAGEILLLDKYTGQATVRFDEPPGYGEEIKASYVVSSVSMPIDIVFNTNDGRKEHQVLLEVSR